MASTSETGHAKNVANFDTLISAITGFGTTYNPSRAALKLPALQALSTTAKASLANINTLSPSYTNAVAARKVAFDPLAKLITKVSNAIKATDTSTQTDDTVMTVIRKLQGRRATTLSAEDSKNKENNQISVSQMSFDSKVENLDKLIKLLASIPLYAPNETELKVATLITLLADLKAKNTAVLTALTPLNNARISRNDLLYKSNTGLVDIALDVKTYLKSLYGVSSPQYKLVSKLGFRLS